MFLFPKFPQTESSTTKYILNNNYAMVQIGAIKIKTILQWGREVRKFLT